MLRRVALSVLALALATVGVGAISVAAASAAPTVLASYAANRALTGADPVTGFDAGYGVVAWSTFVGKGSRAHSEVHLRLPSGTVKVASVTGDVLAVVRVNGPSGTPGVRVILQTCRALTCTRSAFDPLNGTTWVPTQPWLDQLIGDGGSATDGASTVQDGTALTVQPAVPGVTSCGVTAFSLDDTTRQGDLPSIPECTAPAWVQIRGSLIVARTSMPTLTKKHYRWQSVVLDTSAPVPAWTRIAIATQDPTGGTFIKREAIGPDSVTFLEEPFRAGAKTGTTIDSAPRRLLRTTISAPSPYAPVIASDPSPVPLATTLHSPLLAIRSDGTTFFALRQQRSAAGRTTFQVLQLPS